MDYASVFSSGPYLVDGVGSSKDSWLVWRFQGQWAPGLLRRFGLAYGTDRVKSNIPLHSQFSKASPDPPMT